MRLGKYILYAWYHISQNICAQICMLYTYFMSEIVFEIYARTFIWVDVHKSKPKVVLFGNWINLLLSIKSKTFLFRPIYFILF